MAQTYRNRLTYEVALLVRDNHDNGLNERAQAGDIIAVRKPFGHGEVGRGERSLFLWLRIEAQQQIDELDLTQLSEAGGVRFEKRRYCIPFARLAQVAPWVSLPRILDVADPYQPFMGGIDTDQDYDVLTFASAFAVLTGEGQTAAQANALLDPLKESVLTKRLGRSNRLDLQKLGTREIYRRHGDGSFALQLGGEQTGGHYLAPRAPLAVEGLVFDKQTGRYL